MPGMREKLDVLAEHLRRERLIWHGDDRLDDDRFDRQVPVNQRPARKPR